MFHRKFIFLIGFLLLIPKTSMATTLLGCWSQLGVLKIVEKDSRELEMIHHFHDGTKRALVLKKTADGFMHDVRSQFGDKYRISKNGALEIYDREGYIRTLKPTNIGC